MRCAARAAWTGFELEPIVPAVEPWRYRNKMEYSFGTVRGRRRWRSASTAAGAGTWSTTRATACSRPSAATRSATWSATGAGSAGWTPWTGARSEGFLRNLVVREGRRTGELQVRLVTADGQFEQEELCRGGGCRLSGRRRPVDPHEPARRGVPGRRDRGAGGLRRAPRGALRPALPHLSGGVLPDEHGDGRTALRPGARLRATVRQRAGVRPVLRNRHAQPHARAARRRGVGAGHRARGDRRRDRERAPERDRERLLLRR